MNRAVGTAAVQVATARTAAVQTATVAAAQPAAGPVDPARLAGLHLVTDPGLTAARGLLATVDAAVRGGVAVVQVRDKHADARDLLATLVAVADVVAGRALVLVDDRADVAWAARRRGARVDGVHVGQSDLPPLEARALLGPDAVVGLTANTAEHLAEVAALPVGTVDYLGVGVVHPTTTKADHPDPLGTEGVGRLAAATPVPCVAIGGVTVADLPALVAAGAHGAAVVSGVCGADDPDAAAAELVAAWSGARS